MSEKTAKIEFVNKKSVERVSHLVSELRENFESVKPTIVEHTANKILEKIDKEPLFGISEESFLHFKINGEEVPKYKSPLQPLQPYSFTFPPTLPKEISEKEKSDELALKKKQFIIESRQEHHRLLWAFQDRLTFDAYSQEGSGFKSPFNTAAKLLAKEMEIPFNENDTKEGKTASLLRKSQSESSEILDRQLKVAKMIQDREQYRLNNALDASLPRKASEVPVVFPFSILCDNESSK